MTGAGGGDLESAGLGGYFDFSVSKTCGVGATRVAERKSIRMAPLMSPSFSLTAARRTTMSTSFTSDCIAVLRDWRGALGNESTGECMKASICFNTCEVRLCRAPPRDVLTKHTLANANSLRHFDKHELSLTTSVIAAVKAMAAWGLAPLGTLFRTGTAWFGTKDGLSLAGRNPTAWTPVWDEECAGPAESHAH